MNDQFEEMGSDVVIGPAPGGNQLASRIMERPPERQKEKDLHRVTATVFSLSRTRSTTLASRKAHRRVWERAG
jgi:hypothetical protein